MVSTTIQLEDTLNFNREDQISTYKGMYKVSHDITCAQNVPSCCGVVGMDATPIFVILEEVVDELFLLLL